MNRFVSLWADVDRLIDRAPSLHALRAHRLQLLAARRWRTLNRTIPPDLLQEEALAAIHVLLVPVVLERIRAAYDDEIVIFKGPEVAARYPDPALRSFVDIDLLVPDPERAHAALLAGGFHETPDPPWGFRRGREVDLFAQRHHTRPLYLPQFPLVVELHRRPSWPRWLPSPPSTLKLLDSAVPSSLAVEGIQTLAPTHHALIIGVHSWSHDPASTARDLIDVLAMAEGLDREELERTADDWGVGRLWRTTIGIAESVVLGGHTTLAERVWARNVTGLRERTVFENHLESWLSCFWTLPPRPALARALRNVAWDLRPAVDESWHEKLKRVAIAGRNARKPKAVHDESLGLAAKQMHPPRKWRTRQRRDAG